MLTFNTFNAYISAEPDYLPLIATTGVFLLEANHITELYLHNHSFASASEVHKQRLFIYLTPLIPLSFEGEGEEILERGEAPLLPSLPLPLVREGGQGDRLLNDFTC